jgi:hypothetical protein
MPAYPAWYNCVINYADNAMPRKLIPQWRQFWKLYSTWWFVLLGMIGAAGDLVNAGLDYLDLPYWMKIPIYMAFAGAGIYSRLKLQAPTVTAKCP